MREDRISNTMIKKFKKSNSLQSLFIHDQGFKSMVEPTHFLEKSTVEDISSGVPKSNGQES